MALATQRSDKIVICSSRVRYGTRSSQKLLVHPRGVAAKDFVTGSESSGILLARKRPGVHLRHQRAKIKVSIPKAV
jgi:hypothetical protein